MARETAYTCTECGLQSAQWHGQCPGCEAWNTLVEERLPTVARGSGGRGGKRGVGAGAGGASAASTGTGCSR